MIDGMVLIKYYDSYSKVELHSSDFNASECIDWLAVWPTCSNAVSYLTVTEFWFTIVAEQKHMTWLQVEQKFFF